MNELTIKNFDTLELNELKNIDGEGSLTVGICIVDGVIVGYNEAKK